MKMRFVISLITVVCINSGFAADSLYVSGNVQLNTGGAPEPAAGAIVTIMIGGSAGGILVITDTTDALGNYTMASKPLYGGNAGGASFYLSVKSPGCYADTSFTVQVPAPNDGVVDRITRNILLRRSGSCGDSLIIVGSVKDSTGTPISGASVRVLKGYLGWLETTTGVSGTFSFAAVNRDTLHTFRVTAGAPGYFSKTDSVTFRNVKDGLKDSANVQFQLRRNPNAGIGSSPSRNTLNIGRPSSALMNGTLTLYLGSLYTSAKIGIKDLRGRNVAGAIAVNTDKVVMDAKHLKNGVYVVQIEGGAGRSGSYKVVIR